MKIDVTKILLVAALIFIGWQSFFKKTPDKVPKPITITIPEVTGSSGLKKLDTVFVTETITVKGKTIEIDKGYKKMYEEALDSLKKKEVFLQAIKINKYADTIVNNEDITIEGKATTRGTLLDYSVDYTIKKKQVIYTPEVITKFPDLSVGLGIEAGADVNTWDKLSVKANVSLMNKRGNEINASYDTNGVWWVGYKKIFKILK